MEKLSERIKSRILLLDGAMGTCLMGKGLTPSDFGEEKFEGCNEILSLTRPDAVRSVHEDYLKAGADIIETNSFAGSRLTLSEFGLGERTFEINLAAAKLARECADEFSTEEQPRFVAGSIGPTNKSLSLSQEVTFGQMRDSYYEQAKGLAKGGVDFFLIETIFDTLNAKAAFSGLQRLFSDSSELPVAFSFTIEKGGVMLAGQDIEAAYVSIAHAKPFAVGMNCGLGPDMMQGHLKELSGIASTNTICYPNAGMPREDGTFPLSPAEFANIMKKIMKQKLANIVGGCCGTTPKHIAKLRKLISNSEIRRIPSVSRSALSGIETVAIDEDTRPVIVGERTNSIGSKKFRELIASGQLEIAAEIGRAQVEKGAHIIDICLANPERDEPSDTEKFYSIVTKKVRVPLMIDSTNPKAIVMALERTQGKCIINSLNFEDGFGRAKEVMPLAKEYGAAIVFGTIDEDGGQAMAKTVEKKLSIAQRARDYLVKEWGFPEEDIILDPLTFPAASGDANYSGSAKTTIDAIRELKKAFPKSKTILGVSNVSFGLPPAGREILNSVFLYHAVNAGLDMAIVNSEKLIRYPSISKKERELAEDLLFERTKDPITPFVNMYRDKVEEQVKRSELPLDERLESFITEGRKDGLTEALKEARKARTPLEIINGPLMGGMRKVGDLFRENKLIVSEVLQSAESMKAAISYLENFMETGSTAKRGKVILATVKGDVHDIGKNLVHILLKNNYYEVIDLGIKVPPEKIIAACKEHKPDVICLSGLLVKSAEMMVVTAEALKEAGISVPLLVGGAALTEKFTKEKIAKAYSGPVLYSKDAMAGLRQVEELISHKGKVKKEKVPQEAAVPPRTEQMKEGPAPPHSAPAHPRKAPDLLPRILKDFDLQEVFSNIDKKRLYSMHLGLEGNEGKAKILTGQVEETESFIIKNNLLEPRAIYQFFECNSRGTSIVVFQGEKEPETLDFERQKGGEGLCVSDFVAQEGAGRDSICLFVTSCGKGVREKAEELRESGEYLKSHLLQLLALECAEALADMVHKRIREEWGIEAKGAQKNKPQGIRISYGYPMCRDLGEQKKLFKLLKPENIGVKLSSGLMMDPEASVSALVFHNPNAKYF